jgi:hypothetical protein
LLAFSGYGVVLANDAEGLLATSPQARPSVQSSARWVPAATRLPRVKQVAWNDPAAAEPVPSRTSHEPLLTLDQLEQMALESGPRRS